MDALKAKKSMLMKLISMMDDETSEKLKPDAEIEVMKIEGKPKHMMQRLEEGAEEDSDDYETEDSDIKSFLGSPEMDGEKEDMSVLDRFKKKYQQG